MEAASLSLQFSGIFQGRESEIRITPDKKWVSVYDFISVAGGQNDPYNTWKNITLNYKEEVQHSLQDFQFKGQGQRPTPVITAQGLVKLLMWIPGETAKQFRSASAGILVRYLGGDTTLVKEIEAINQAHIEQPDNAELFSQHYLAA